MKKFVLYTSCLAATLLATPAFAGIRYWDNDQTAAGNDATTGAGLGGSGNWDTTALKWWDGVSASDVAWVNANSDDAVIKGAGSVNLTNTVQITAHSLTLGQSGNFKSPLSAIGAALFLAPGADGMFSITNLTPFVGNTAGSNYIGTLLTNNATGNASALYVTGPGIVYLDNQTNGFTNIVVDGGALGVFNAGATTGQGPYGLQTGTQTNVVVMNGGKLRLQNTGAGRVLFGSNRHMTIGTGGGIVELEDSAYAGGVDGNGGVGVSTCTIYIGANTLTVQGRGVWGISGTSAGSANSVQGSAGGTLLVKDTAVIRIRSYAERLYSAIKVNLQDPNTGLEFGLTGNQTIAELSGTGYVSSQTGTGTLIVKPGTGVTSTFSGKFCDAHITKDGSGTLIVNGPAGTGLSTHNFTVTAGTLQIGSDTALAGDTLRFNGGTIRTEGSTARTLANPVTFLGSAQTLGASSSGSLTFTGTFGLGGSSSTLTVNSVRVTFSGVASGTAGLIRAGNSSGTLVFSGANTFGSAANGVTNNAGTLLINNATGSGLGVSSLYNGSSATFGGTGKMNGSVTNLGTINPGDSTVNNGVGTVHIGGNLELATAGKLKMDVFANAVSQGVNQDYLHVTNALTIDGTWTLTVNGPAGNTFADDTTDYSYTIVTADGGITGFDANNVTITTSGLAMGNGAFRVRQSGNSIILDYIHPPYITASTIGQSVNLGGTANMSVTAAGTGTLTYQWQKNGVNISGETTAAYSIASVQLTDAATYTCVVTGDYTPAATPSGVLAIRPYFTLQPVSSTNNPGDSLTFSALAEGSGTLAYQWKKDGVNIPGATLNTLTFNPVKGTNAAEELGYTVTVTNNSDTTITSSAALLRVTPEIVTTLPANTYAYSGDVTLTIAATGTTNLYYTWYKDGVALYDEFKYGGTNTPSLTVSNVIVGADNGTYSVIVTNIVGSNTNSTYLTVTRTPAIVSQPQSTTNVSGTTANFTVSAVGEPPLYYIWRKGGVAIDAGANPSAATATLTLSNVQTADEGGYDVIVSNVVDSVAYSVTSAPPATLTVYYPLTATGPGNQTVVSNNTANFTVSVTSANNGPISYQWRKNGANISNGAKYSGVTTPSLQVLNCVQADAGTYSVVLSSFAGSITNSGTLTVLDPPAITVQPVTANKGQGTNATFSVTAVGTAPLSYQWQSIIGGVTNDVVGATSSSMTINASHSVEGQYQCVVTNDAGSVTSTPANLFVYDLPQIDTAPTSLLVTNGDTAVFTVAASQNTTAGAPLSLSYQWKNGGTAYTGATTTTLTIPNAQLSDQSTNIVVVITNVAGAVTSSPVSLTVYQSVTIAKQPTPELSVRPNTSATLSVTAIGNPLAYQWYKNGDAIAGATGSSHTIASTTVNDFGYYHVVITNLFGSVTSSTSILGAHWTNAWQAAVNSRSYLVGGDNNRGMAYNPATGHLLVVNGPNSGTAPTIGIVDAATGADLPPLSVAGIPATGSQKSLIRIVANDDGVIYGCNLSLNSAFILYRWQDESSAPVQVYNPSIAGTSRWGDMLAIRGVGSGTQILISGGSTTTNMALLKTSDAVNGGGNAGSWSFVQVGNASLVNGEFYNGLYFGGSGDTLHSKASNSDANKLWNFDPVTGAATLSSTRNGFDSNLIGVTEDFANNLVFGANFITHRLQVYDVSGGNVYGIVDYAMPTANANANFAGTVVGVPSGDLVIGLEANNGLLAVQKQAYPTITTDISGSTVNAGTTVNLTVGIDQPIAYVVWKKDGVTIPGETGATLTLNNVTKANEGNYQAIVVSGVGPVTSSTAALTVTDPAINTQPTGQTVNAYQAVSLSVGAGGTGLSYQWQKNNGNISGATDSSFSIASAVVADSGSYRVIVNGTYGSVTSSVVTVTVNPLPLTITATNRSKFFGQLITFNGTEFINSPLSNGDTITSASISSAGASAGAAIGSYPINISGAVGTGLENYDITYVPGTLSVDGAIAITKNPVSLTKFPGQSATFSVTATGSNRSYQWKKDGNPITGANGTSYTINPVTTGDAGSYTVTVSNAADTKTSTAATLTVSADTVLPKVVVIKPAANAHYTDPTVSGYSLAVNGTASDNARVDHVYMSINNGPFTELSITPGAMVSWSSSVTVVPGLNTFKAYCVDYSGSNSVTVVNKFYYDVTKTVTINKVKTPNTGSFVPTLTGPTNGAPLLVGQTYKLITVADPTSGYILTNWTASWQDHALSVEQTNNLTYTFTMQSNMVINVNFITNPFAIYQGGYVGLFNEADEVRLSSAGWIYSVKVTPKMGLSGKLSVDGNTLAISGKFRIDGSVDTIVKRGKVDKGDLALHLQLDFGGGSQTLTGTLSPTNGAWTANVTADRIVWQTNGVPANPATLYTNAYTMLIPSSGFDNTNGPAGHSVATISVNDLGKATVSMALSDGTKAFKVISYVNKDGYIPVFGYPATYLQPRITVATAALIKEYFGGIFGWLHLATTNNASGNMAPGGGLDWLWVPSGDSRTNTGWSLGFTNQSDVVGSRWLGVAPLFPNSATNAFAAVSGGGIAADFVANLTVTTNKILPSLPKTNAFGVALNIKSGGVSGAFTNAGFTGQIKWTGVLLQDSTNGYGYFLKGGLPSTNSGQIHITTP